MSKTTENYGFTKPEVRESFSLETWNGNMDKIDGELKKRENAQKESDISLMNPKFTEAKERKNLTSGEKIHLMLGKISKFFSDMKAIAFSGSYNDLVDKPKIPTVLNNQTTTEEGFALDARQANPNIDGTLAKQVADLNGSLTLETFTKRIYNDRTVFLTGVITGDATIAALYYPNSIKPQSVNIANQINIFNTGITDVQSYSINDDILLVNLQQASVSGRACGAYVKLTY